MIDRQALVNSIKLHEGYSKKAYRDSVDVLTVGWGTNVSFIENPARHIEWLNRDIDAAIESARMWVLDIWDSISPRRQAVLAEMVYQLGASGVAKFAKLHDALLNLDFAEAARQMRESRWFEQVPSRAAELVAAMVKG